MARILKTPSKANATFVVSLEECTRAFQRFHDTNIWQLERWIEKDFARYALLESCKMCHVPAPSGMIR